MRGRVIAKNRVACAAPAGHGTVSVKVAGRSRNDVFGTSDAVFEYVAAPRVLSLSPKMGWTAGSYDIDLRMSQASTTVRVVLTMYLWKAPAIKIVRCRAPRLQEGTTSVKVGCGGRALGPAQCE